MPSPLGTLKPLRSKSHFVTEMPILTSPGRLLRMIASRVRDEVDCSMTQGRISSSELGHNNTNLKTVAVLPFSRNVPVAAFARKLQAALEGIGASTMYLNQATVSTHLGKHAFTRMGKLKVRFDISASQSSFNIYH